MIYIKNDIICNFYIWCYFKNKLIVMIQLKYYIISLNYNALFYGHDALDMYKK